MSRWRAFQRVPRRWHPGHQYVMRAWSPCRLLVIVVPQRKQVAPVRMYGWVYDRSASSSRLHTRVQGSTWARKSTVASAQ